MALRVASENVAALSPSLVCHLCTAQTPQCYISLLLISIGMRARNCGQFLPVASIHLFLLTRSSYFMLLRFVERGTSGLSLLRRHVARQRGSERHNRPHIPAYIRWEKERATFKELDVPGLVSQMFAVEILIVACPLPPPPLSPLAPPCLAWAARPVVSG